LTDGREVISTQVKAEESSPSVQCLVLKLFSGLKDRHSIPVSVLYRHSTSSGVALQSLQAFQGCDVNQVYRKACIRSVTACRYRSLSKTSTQQRVSIRAKKWMGKNMLFKKGSYFFALTSFCPNKIPVGSRDISNHYDSRTTFQSSAVPSAAVLDFEFENGCIDRWARGDLDTSQGRGIEPFGLMLGSQVVFGFTVIAVRFLSLLRVVILRSLVSRCNHVTRSKYAMLFKSIARLASDPLQHVVIEPGRLRPCNNVFRLGQKNGWAKICCPKNGFHVFALTCFCPNMISADSRDISNRDDRTNYVSKLGCSVCRRPGF
jgi:hypothetical protein